MSSNKQYVLGVVVDLISDFLYYNRKEDEDLPVGYIEELINSGELTVKELSEKFEEELTRCIR